MAFAQSPQSSSRARYAASFQSSIFEPAEQRADPAFVPAGKRRDQSTSEMFGHYAEKDLRSCPKTFVPSEDLTNARQKRQQFLSSDVLPRSQYPAPMDQREPTYMHQGNDSDEEIDPNLRRQAELSSQLFDRATPQCTAEQVHDRSTRLTPNDFSWHNHPQKVDAGSTAGYDNHSSRAYKEKCSSVFGHKSPQRLGGGYMNSEADRAIREEESIADSKRRHNCNYSDLFGRETPMDAPEANQHGPFRPKHQGSHEDKIIVHADWTDSKTELMSKGGVERPEHPTLRKGDELHRMRIFGRDSCGNPPSVDRPESMTYDNSHKVKDSLGQHTQTIHQRHLRTSLQSDEFYQEAESTKHWEVVELHISGLPIDADNERLKQLCQNCDLHIVKVAVDMDPVRNLCKGRGKVMVRYNPMRDSIEGLTRRLEGQNLRVEV